MTCPNRPHGEYDEYCDVCDGGQVVPAPEVAHTHVPQANPPAMRDECRCGAHRNWNSETWFVPGLRARGPQPRPSWDEYFMGFARAASVRGSCYRLQVGAVIAVDNNLIATGYNGAPSGWPSCWDEDHELADINGRQSCIRTIHAEENAIIQCARHGVSALGGTIYTTAAPCYDCAKRIAQVGIVRVVYAAKYSSARNGDRDVMLALARAKIATVYLPNS